MVVDAARDVDDDVLGDIEVSAGESRDRARPGRGIAVARVRRVDVVAVADVGGGGSGVGVEGHAGDEPLLSGLGLEVVEECRRRQRAVDAGRHRVDLPVRRRAEESAVGAEAQASPRDADRRGLDLSVEGDFRCARRDGAAGGESCRVRGEARAGHVRHGASDDELVRPIGQQELARRERDRVAAAADGDGGRDDAVVDCVEQVDAGRRHRRRVDRAVRQADVDSNEGVALDVRRRCVGTGGDDARTFEDGRRGPTDLEMIITGCKAAGAVGVLVERDNAGRPVGAEEGGAVRLRHGERVRRVTPDAAVDAELCRDGAGVGISDEAEVERAGAAPVGGEDEAVAVGRGRRALKPAAAVGPLVDKLQPRAGVVVKGDDLDEAVRVAAEEDAGLFVAGVEEAERPAVAGEACFDDEVVAGVEADLERVDERVVAAAVAAVVAGKAGKVEAAVGDLEQVGLVAVAVGVGLHLGEAGARAVGVDQAAGVAVEVEAVRQADARRRHQPAVLERLEIAVDVTGRLAECGSGAARGGA